MDQDFIFQYLIGMIPDLVWAEFVGQCHHARWMAPDIYTLKMLICGEERFQMGQKQAKGLLDLGYFLLYIYGRYWFAAPVAADAPFLTLSLWKDLQKWAARDPSLSAALTRKLDRHTWYLSGRHVVFALFSDKVEDATKRKMADAMKRPENAGQEIPPGKPDLPEINANSNLEDYINHESWLLFQVTLYFCKILLFD